MLEIPEAGETGANILQQIYPNIKQGRSGTIIKGPNQERINPNKMYQPQELYDKFGNPVKIGQMPDRTKGGFWGDLFREIFSSSSQQPVQHQRYTQTPSVQPTQQTQLQNNLFWGQRTALSKKIITEQVTDIAKNRFKNDVSFDNKEAHWMVVNSFLLPSIWHYMPGVVNNRTQLAIVFPTDYPRLPPIGFYLKADISKSPNRSHFFQQAYHDADKVMLSHGWKWYCVYVNPGSWQPGIYRQPLDWRKPGTDNIWTYFDLIGETLTSRD
ncbi:MAG: hypothetical protein KKD66_26625 [Proteobacteria bacterium]|nr:hypothetical protein [Pseudomonadota bacterium]MBU1599996.1 hypothetical protein [bacterium]